MDNFTRISRASLLIAAYSKMAGVETNAPEEQMLTDILTDLQHLAADMELDFAASLRMSEMHFEAEKE